jgi:hypothetical protein
MQRLPQSAAINGSPQSPTSIRAEFEITVERKFDRVRNGDVCALQLNGRNWALFGSLKSSLTCESELSTNPGCTGTTVGKTSGAQMAICSRKD